LHKQLAKTGISSARVNSNIQRKNAKFIKFYSAFRMPLNGKVVCLDILHIFPLGDFEVLKQKFEERGKVLSAVIDKVMT
jgi:hypothetical protein